MGDLFKDPHLSVYILGDLESFNFAFNYRFWFRNLFVAVDTTSNGNTQFH